MQGLDDDITNSDAPSISDTKFTIITGDGHEKVVSSSLLRGAKYFQPILKGEFKEGKDKIIRIQQTKEIFDIILEMLQYGNASFESVLEKCKNFTLPKLLIDMNYFGLSSTFIESFETFAAHYSSCSDCGVRCLKYHDETKKSANRKLKKPCDGYAFWECSACGCVQPLFDLMHRDFRGNRLFCEYCRIELKFLSAKPKATDLAKIYFVGESLCKTCIEKRNREFKKAKHAYHNAHLFQMIF